MRPGSSALTGRPVVKRQCARSDGVGSVRTAKVLPAPGFNPLCDQIRALIIRSLIAGEWRAGEAVPSELELGRRYRVSSGTIREAIDRLVAENILVRRQDQGTFVSTRTEDPAIRLLGVVADSGDEARLVSKLQYFQQCKAPAVLAHALRVRPGAPLYSIRRMLRLSGRPLGFEEICIPAALFKGLGPTELSACRGSLYRLYETRYGLQIVRAQDRIRAVAAEESAAAWLGIDLGTPLLCLDRIAFTYDNEPVEWRRTFAMRAKVHAGLCSRHDPHHGGGI